MLVDHMKEGFSYESFAAIAETHVDTLYEWEKVHPEFSDAKGKARVLGLLYDEQMLKELIARDGRGYSMTGQIYKMKCRYRKLGWNDAPKEESEDSRIEVHVK